MPALAEVPVEKGRAALEPPDARTTVRARNRLGWLELSTASTPYTLPSSSWIRSCAVTPYSMVPPSSSMRAERVSTIDAPPPAGISRGPFEVRK